MFGHLLAHLSTFKHIWGLFGTLVLLLPHLDYFSTLCTYEHFGATISTIGSF